MENKWKKKKPEDKGGSLSSGYVPGFLKYWVQVHVDDTVLLPGQAVDYTPDTEIRIEMITLQCDPEGVPLVHGDSYEVARLVEYKQGGCHAGFGREEMDRIQHLTKPEGFSQVNHLRGVLGASAGIGLISDHRQAYHYTLAELEEAVGSEDMYAPPEEHATPLPYICLEYPSGDSYADHRTGRDICLREIPVPIGYGWPLSRVYPENTPSMNDIIRYVNRWCGGKIGTSYLGAFGYVSRTWRTKVPVYLAWPKSTTTGNTGGLPSSTTYIPTWVQEKIEKTPDPKLDLVSSRQSGCITIDHNHPTDQWDRKVRQQLMELSMGRYMADAQRQRPLSAGLPVKPAVQQLVLKQ